MGVVSTTPGPWHVAAPGFDLGRQIVAVTAHGEQIVSGSDVATFEDAGNAALIAAARDLVAAARRMLPTPERMEQHAAAPDEERFDLLTSFGAIRQLAAAVAKSEGRP